MMTATMTTTTTTMTMTEDSQPTPRLSRLTLRRRIVGSISLLSAIGLLAAGLAALVVERGRIVDGVSSSLAQEISEFREFADRGVDPDTGERFVTAERLITISMLRNVPDDNEAHIGFVRDANIAAEGSGTLHNEPEFRAEVTRHQSAVFGEYRSPTHGRIVYAVLPIEHTQDLSHYVVAHYLDNEITGLDDTIRVYGIAALLAWLGLTLAAWLLARRIIAPIDELRETAENITETDLNRRIAVTGGDEVAAMGSTFNRMLDRMQAALAGQRRMLDDAGHELRTPITVVRGHLELMDPHDSADVEATRDLAIDELDRMNLLVQDLILLAKAQRPDFLTREPVELHILVEGVRDKASGLGEREWVVDPSEPITHFADPRRLTQAMLQLASNAYKVTDRGDLIAFGCSSTSQGVQLWVRDSGPGVPPADRDRIFTRFQSGTSVSAGGAGLGLAIVAAIAEAHDGTAHVTDATSAGGAKFIIELPHRRGEETGTHTIITEPVPPLAEADPANDTQPRDRSAREDSAEHSLADRLPREVADPAGERTDLAGERTDLTGERTEQ